MVRITISRTCTGFRTLKDCCEQDLLDKISEKSISIPEYERGEALSFYYLMLEITSFTTDSVRAMNYCVTSLNVSFSKVRIFLLQSHNLAALFLA